MLNNPPSHVILQALVDGVAHMLKQRIKQYFSNIHKSPQKITAVLVVLLVAGIGTHLIIGSHAATPYASISADKGTTTCGASVVSDSAASDGNKVVFGSCSSSSGPSIYVSQAGTGNGSSCSSAQSAAWFNNGSNWGTGTGQIGPGVSVDICGTISTTLTAQGSGTSGDPITIAFQSGAILEQPICSSGTGCLNISNVNYITVNGENTGTIENTANGTNLANQASSTLVQMQNCNNCTVENLTMANAYIPAAGDQDQANSGVPVVGINLVSGDNDTITANTMFYDHWAISTEAATSDSMENLRISNNTLHDNDHDIITSTGNIANGNTPGTSGPWYIYGNHMYDFSSWDVNPLYHHDGIHCWGQNNDVPPNINGFYIYNNDFGGNFGLYTTSAAYIEGTTGPTCASATSPVYFFNNVFNPTGGKFSNGAIGMYSGLPFIYNNTFIGIGAGTSTASSNIENSDGSSVSGVIDLRNNVISGGNPELSEGKGLTAASNYNLYAASTTAGSEAWQCNGNLYDWSASGFANWQSCTGADKNSSFVDNADLNSDGSPQSGSPALGAGTNLTSVCNNSGLPSQIATALCKDINGTPRPTTGAWTIGAYQ